MAYRLILICGLLFSTTAYSNNIPSELLKWSDWVGYQQEYRNCPYLNGQKINQKQNFICAWPSKLNLEMKAQRMAFVQRWQVIEESKIPLPGNKELWPQGVLVNQKKAVVLENGSQPYILLPKGNYQIQGYIEWAKQPESFPIPKQADLIQLVINDKKQDFIDRRGNLIWLGREKLTELKEKDYLKLRVNRLIRDNHPMTMSVAIDLEIGGSGREKKLTQFNLQQYQLTSINSRLNSRIDNQGNLWVQLKSGHYQIHLEFKLHGFPEELIFNESGDFWPTEEIWVFKNNERLRSTQIENVSPIDANQGFMQGWKDLPHYVLNKNDSFKIKQRHRGITHSSDRLTLNRKMWLSFDNSTYYFFDSIQGTKSKDWRINTIKDYRLTQLSNHAKDRLITYDTKKRTGAEIRTSTIAIKASGEVDSQNMKHASGWDVDFATTKVRLNIPPGRKLFSIRGADNSYGDWINQWDLLDIFFILITLALVYKFFGILPALIALVALILSYHEQNVPMFLWLNFTVALSLASKITKTSLLKALNIYKWISVGLLLLALLPFLAEQIRFSLHPQLEISKSINSNQSYRFFDSEYSDKQPLSQGVEKKSMPIRMQANELRALREPEIKSKQRLRKLVPPSMNSYEQGAVIQAGKGKPSWGWRSAQYSWNGPVNGAELVEITVLSESVVKLLRIMIIIFSALWFLMMLNKDFNLKNYFTGVFKKASKVTASAAILILLANFSFQPSVKASEIPNDKMLTELQNRLYPQPNCLPDCVSSPKAKLIVNGDRLKLELFFQSNIKVATIIPSSADWNIEKLLMNGKPYKYLWKNTLGSWINLPKGETKLVIVAKLKNKSELTIQFLEQPKIIKHQLSGWNITGINSDHLESNFIQLTRDSKKLSTDILINQKHGQPTAQEQSIENLLFMTRRFTFSTQWNLETKVRRKAPKNSAITAKIPLLRFEQPIEMSDKVVNRKMKIVIPRNRYEVSWRSSINDVAEFELIALDEKSITESWQILVYPNWNIQINGIDAVAPHNISGDDYWIYQYFPRAGEKLNFSLTKPPAVEGASVAITRVDQKHTVSKRKTTTHLVIEYVATRAESLEIKIGDAELKNITHDSNVVNLGKVEGIVSIGLKPGKHQLTLEIERALEITFDFNLDKIEIDQTFSNLSTHLILPKNRWLISTSGPGYGPAIIYWGELLFFTLLAFALSRLSFSPLNYLQWLILGLGMSTFSWPALSLIIAWLLAGEWRRQNNTAAKPMKIPVSWLILISSIIAVLVLVGAVSNGLLGSPDMGVRGNDSYGHSLKWFLDQGEKSLGLVTVYTLPLWVYKGLMLLWATWLSFSLIKWLSWVWNDLANAPFKK